jgi:hypothetical protein
VTSGIIYFDVGYFKEVPEQINGSFDIYFTRVTRKISSVGNVLVAQHVTQVLLVGWDWVPKQGPVGPVAISALLCPDHLSSAGRSYVGGNAAGTQVTFLYGLTLSQLNSITKYAYLIEAHFNIIPPPHLSLGVPSVLYTSGFLAEIFDTLSQCVLHVPPI